VCELGVYCFQKLYGKNEIGDDLMAFETFTSTLFRIPGKGGWTFAPIPEKFSPPATESFGRTPVIATVDGQKWSTSVWKDKSGQTLLAIPKKIRGSKGDGDEVEIELEFVF